MVQRDEVLVGEGRLVEVSVRVHILERWLPLGVNSHYYVPEAGQAVNVDDDDEDELEQFQGVLHVLRHVHAFNDNAEA